MNKLKSVFIAVTMLAAGATNAATVLSPTDGDVNFFNISLTNVPWAFELYMLDDSTVINNSLTAANGLFIPLPSIVGVSGPVGIDHIATNSLAQTLVLTGSDNFILAVRNLNTGDWIEDSSVISIGANAQRIIFEYTNANFTTAILAVDVAVTAIPVPAAFWLFGSGLLALAGVGKRFTL